MLRFLQGLEDKKLPIPRQIVPVLLKFMTGIARATAPIPNLEKQPSQKDITHNLQGALKQEMSDQAPPLEERMARLREQQAKFNFKTLKSDKEKKDDSGMMVPILLLGAGIFLYFN